MHSSANNLTSSTIVETIIRHVYSTCQSQLLSGFYQHVCSPANPCKEALESLSPLLGLRLVASLWNDAIQSLRRLPQDPFFSRVEDGYYPYTWHVNTRVRRAVLLHRYRVFRTIISEAGSRGVYLAYDFGSATGCAKPREVVVKAWVDPTDFECQRESAVYRVLESAPCSGIPLPLASAIDPGCDVYALILPKLGPTLEDLRERLPGKRFDERMVLTVAIQMIDRYRDIHARGIVHSGTKAGNICLASLSSSESPSLLYAIDFGFSSTLDTTSTFPLPSPHRIDAVGNRRFMSVFGHHGISQSQRDDLESLAYLLSDLFHGRLPWDTPARPSNPKHLKSPSSVSTTSQPHIWRVKTATPSTVLFEGMDECFHEFWKDVKALAYAEPPAYSKMKERFEICLKRYNNATGPAQDGGWWSIWNSSHQKNDGM